MRIYIMLGGTGPSTAVLYRPATGPIYIMARLCREPCGRMVDQHLRALRDSPVKIAPDRKSVPDSASGRMRT